MTQNAFKHKGTRLSAAHKKSLAVACLAYFALVSLAVLWVVLSPSTVAEEWQRAIPSAQVTIAPGGTAPEVSAISDSESDVDADTDTAAAVPDDASKPSEHAAAAPVGEAAPQEPDFSNSTPAYTTHHVTIVLSGLGMSEKATADALKTMPTEVVFAFTPYAEQLQNWVNQSLARGNEALVLLPMESSLYPEQDPGQKALSPRLSDMENEHYMEWTLKRAQGVTGVMNLMGSRFLSDSSRMPHVFETLKTHDFKFIENPVIKHSIAAQTAQKFDVPYMAVDLKIDDTVSDAAIQQQLAALERLAKERGYAIGIAEPYPITLRHLQKWFSGLESQGIKLANFDTIWNNRLRHDRKK